MIFSLPLRPFVFSDRFLVKHFGNRSRVQGVKGSILVPVTAFGMRIYEKSISFVRLKQNLEPNWQLVAKMSIFDEDFKSLMLPLSLTLNL